MPNPLLLGCSFVQFFSFTKLSCSWADLVQELKKEYIHYSVVVVMMQLAVSIALYGKCVQLITDLLLVFFRIHHLSNIGSFWATSVLTMWKMPIEEWMLRTNFLCWSSSHAVRIPLSDLVWSVLEGKQGRSILGTNSLHSLLTDMLIWLYGFIEPELVTSHVCSVYQYTLR